MVPAYALAFLIFIFTIGNLKIAIRPRTDKAVHDRNWLRIIGTTLGLLLLALSALPPVLIPVIVLPEPTGSYAIGTKYLHFTDNDSHGEIELDTNIKKEIVAQVWYPANPLPNTKPEPYWENASELSTIYSKRLSLMIQSLGRLLNSKMSEMKLPSYWFSHNSLTKTHSYLDAPLANEKQPFPPLIYSHGFFVSHNKHNTALMEELASHGYIVFGIAHAYDAPFFIYPDKTIKDFNARDELLLKQLEAGFDKNYMSLMEKLKKSQNPSEQLALLKEIDKNSKLTGMRQGALERVADVIFLIDELEKINSKEGMFSGKLDLDSLGVLGMSFGGTTAYGVCLVDKRCKAGVSMDGFASSDDMFKTGLTQPFMFMLAENRQGVYDFFYNKAENAAYIVTIKGTEHLNYTDESLIGGFTKLSGQLGKIDGNRCVKIINSYILAFFDKHLKGNASSLLDSPSPDYPEVEFKSRNST